MSGCRVYHDPTVRLVTSPIVEITEAGLRTADGEEHAVDTIIYGTGFRANEYLTSVTIRGRGGRTLRDDWRDGAEAYLGLSVAGYPNLFLLYGPNTNGVNSIIFMHEAQAHYIMRALRLMTRRGLGALEVESARFASVQRAHPARDGGHGVDRRVRQLLPYGERQGRDAAALQRRSLLAPDACVRPPALPRDAAPRLTASPFSQASRRTGRSA